MFDDVVLLESAGKAADVDASLLSDGELLDGVVVFERVRAMIDLAEARCLGEADSRSLPDVEFGMTTAGWLAHIALLSRRTARSRVDMAKGLARGLVEAAGALADGRISGDHVDVLARAGAHRRVGALIVEMQGDLIGLAEGMVFEVWAAHVRALIELLDGDGPEPDDLNRNRLSASDSLDGLTHIKANLTGGHGLTVRTAIDNKADELFRFYSAQHEEHPEISVPERAVLRALALAEICRLSGAVDAASTKPPRAEVSLIIKADEPGQPYTENGVPVPPRPLSALLCDPDLYAVVVDSLGVPLDMGTNLRTANRAQRRAVAARDGGCVFPGCDAPIHWLDNHHLLPWHKGGRTDVDNLVGVCRRHHGIFHRKGWSQALDPDGSLRIQTPTGRVFWGQRHGRQRQGPAPPIE